MLLVDPSVGAKKSSHVYVSVLTVGITSGAIGGEGDGVLIAVLIVLIALFVLVGGDRGIINC